MGTFRGFGSRENPSEGARRLLKGSEARFLVKPSRGCEAAPRKLLTQSFGAGLVCMCVTFQVCVCVYVFTGEGEKGGMGLVIYIYIYMPFSQLALYSIYPPKVLLNWFPQPCSSHRGPAGLHTTIAGPAGLHTPIRGPAGLHTPIRGPAVLHTPSKSGGRLHTPNRGTAGFTN